MKQCNKIPPPPEKPTADECCGSGCTPCIFDYYDRALNDWTEKYGDTNNTQQSNPPKSNPPLSVGNQHESR